MVETHTIEPGDFMTKDIEVFYKGKKLHGIVSITYLPFMNLKYEE